MMGVGKSTIGKIVAKKQELKFIDTDLNIEKKLSMKIAKIFENKGESFFRQVEEKEVLESLKKNIPILKRNLVPLKLVRSFSPVKIILQNKGIKLSGVAIAKRNGFFGEVIPLKKIILNQHICFRTY